MAERKWDLNIVFQSCYVLEDLNWAAALKYSHMLLGFETVTYINPDLPERFFEYAVHKNWKIFDAYKKATIETFGSDVEASVYIDADKRSPVESWIRCSR
ncbi:DUF6345 domain-containing protein [Archaeoglobus neptunius]|uniref:DUF6345 domain-containing protein n=1 Tax=Archaeoglobus neptunius TaxID=2798580 RepID=UPI001925D8E4|nr:DUF6345 domain-containing protein [Archaeoglobus neptunius]